MDELIYSRNIDIDLAITLKDKNSVENIIKNGYDVNSKNTDGNTALHVAIAKDADLEILKMIVSSGANPTLKNNDGKCPLHCLKCKSFFTIENILKLERAYDFKDNIGNSCLHIILGDNMNWSRDVSEIEGFWAMILDNYEMLNIDFNCKNKNGETALISVSNATTHAYMSKHLEYILNKIENLDVFIADKQGNTFLHAYVSSIISEKPNDVDLLKSLLRGELNSCSKTCIKKLLLLKNKDANTPFLLFLENTAIKINVETLNLFLEAGVDLKIHNNRGETALHRVIRNMSYSNGEKEDENIQCLVRSGAEINAKDVYGQVPISLARDFSSVKTLLEMKADLNSRNKFGQTPIFTHLIDPESNVEVIELLLQNNADANILDNHQSSVLHYIAFGCNGVEFIPLLKKFGVKVCTDKLGHLPCHISLYCGYKEAFDALCQCDQNAHDVDIFCLENKIVDMKESPTDFLLNIAHITDCFSKYRMHMKSGLLRLTNIGCVSFTQEGMMIKQFVNELITKLCLEMSCRDKILTNTVIESGSISENTKVGIPDEFDFVCVLEKFGQICEVDEVKTLSDREFAHLKLKKDLEHEDFDYLSDEQGYLDNYAIWKKCERILDNALSKHELFSNPNVYFSGEREKTSYTMLDPTFTFNIVWHGCYYRDLKINIDLVLACRIKGWWPQNTKLHHLPTNIRNNIKDQGALLVFQSELMGKSFDVTISKFRISAMDAEKQYMHCVSNLARDAYIISKIMCDSRICPSVHVDKIQDQDCKDMLTSYMLKMCMFQLWQNENDPQISTLTDYTETELLEFVLQIFRLLLKFASGENLTSFFFPWINVFIKKNVYEYEHIRCTYRKVFVKLILSVLGDTQQFNDIDVECMSKYWDITDSEDSCQSD